MPDTALHAPLPPAVDAWLKDRRRDPAHRQQAIDLLSQMVQVDTTPKPCPKASAQAEARVFDLIEGFLAAGSPDVQMERVPIRDAIGEHPYFTVPYYASDVLTEAGPDISPRELVSRVYRNRSDLFVRLPRAGLGVLAFNAHIDTVAPHVPPRVVGDMVYGRGAVDDKGPCLAMMLTIRLLAEIANRFGLQPTRELLFQFVIDEETGGNGSLSATLEKKKGWFDAIVVLESTGLQISPGNRGVVWYQTRLNISPEVRVPAGRDILLEAAAFVVGAFGQCGRRIKAESDHPLFPHRPVQTCHGIINSFGQHPSRVNDYVPLRLAWQEPLVTEIRRLVEEAVAEYCETYGDKTRPGAGDGVIERHLAWSDVSDAGATLEVFGLAGHMGSVDRLDGAITKAAAIIRKLVTTRQQRSEDLSSLTVTLTRQADANRLLLEGGQGFLPTHRLEDVAQRMRQAAREGADEYLSLMGLPGEAIACETRFDKLHNDAFARPADGPVMTSILKAAWDSGTYAGQPIRGWDVSCDARIFAREFPNAEVITFGPGALSQAHSNDEHGDINDVLAAAETLTRLALTCRDGSGSD
ncbi:MAG TPA: M20/M25/M40 family metallo-hydrolase [Phycisphaerae bacterium]|nr:M20/M25/M40 family metallo-hydrolase [Phycisphaerae bacterium]